MKRYFLLLVLITGLSACQKIESNTLISKQAVIDDQKIQDYIKANNIIATKDPNTGVYYKIINQGDAVDPISGNPNIKPNALSTVKLTYHYEYLNGVSIGNVTGVQAKVSAFISGIQVGVVKLYTGGRILLIVPSGQAYGPGDQNGIPGNSVIVYTLDLDGVTAN